MKELTDAFEEATAAKLKCQQEADATNLTISLANRLVGGLASENVRWAESVKQFKIQEKMLPGDVLLITAFISYFGYFTKACFQNALFSYWSTNDIAPFLGAIFENINRLIAMNSWQTLWNS